MFELLKVICEYSKCDSLANGLLFCRYEKCSKLIADFNAGILKAKPGCSVETTLEV